MSDVNLSGSDSSRAVYAISVVAEIVGVGAQTIRLYERKGLVEPARTEGGTRRYSQDDLVRLQRIAELMAEGLNLAGILLVLRLEAENARLRAELRRRPSPLEEPG